jgi:hypothetical protein
VRRAPHTWYYGPCFGGRIPLALWQAEGGGRRAEANGILMPALGEVAEPGLRRTPGERVNSEGFRGFKSPPLRQRVCTFCLHFGEGRNFVRNVAFFLPPAHRREPAQAEFARFGEHSLCES